MNVLIAFHQRFSINGGRSPRRRSAAGPPNACVLDIGCGDGLLSQRILAKRPDIQITGVDVLVRPSTHIPVTAFDGRRLPYEDKTVDVALFVDVLHHTSDPTSLLREAKRVAKDCFDHQGPTKRTPLQT